MGNFPHSVSPKIDFRSFPFRRIRHLLLKANWHNDLDVVSEDCIFLSNSGMDDLMSDAGRGSIFCDG